MSVYGSPTPVRPDTAPLHEIDDLLDEIARLARSQSSPQAFHLEVLDRAIRALSAVGGAVWLRPPGGTWRIDSRADLTGNRLIESLDKEPAHRALLDSTIESKQGRIVLPRAGTAGEASANPTEYLLLVCPIAPPGDERLVAALEVAQRTGGPPSAQQGSLRLLEALCELAADYHSQRRFRVLQEAAARAALIDQLSLCVHASLELVPTACAIANEGRRLIDCDRLSVAVRRGRSFRLVAVSGLETLDRRANLVRRLEDLTDAVVAAGEPLWIDGTSGGLAPEIAAPLHAWQDESHARSLAIIPLQTTAPVDESLDRQPAAAALVAELFEGVLSDEGHRDRVDAVARHAGAALQNALAYESFPFFRVLRTWRKMRWFVEAGRLPRTAAAAGLAVAAVLALIFIPADFEIEGRGVLQPRNRRDVFARTDGVVAEVRADHARECRAGDVLVVMTRSQLDFDWSRVLGEIQTARKRLAGVQASRLDVTPQTAADREKYNQLTSDEEEIQELLKGLDAQREVLKAQRDELVVRSPIDGQIVTWNVRQSLDSRPIERGQVLLQVADLSGPWALEVEVPDDRVGPVLAARQEQHADLTVSFVLATEPGTIYRGAVEKVALATDVRPPEKANVQVTVLVDRDAIKGLRPNATVVSRIHCGRRSIGFVWFHSFWEMIQKKVLF